MTKATGSSHRSEFNLGRHCEAKQVNFILTLMLLSPKQTPHLNEEFAKGRGCFVQQAVEEKVREDTIAVNLTYRMLIIN